MDLTRGGEYNRLPAARRRRDLPDQSHRRSIRVAESFEKSRQSCLGNPVAVSEAPYYRLARA